MAWMDLAEMFHRPLRETMATVDNAELYLWIARNKRRNPPRKG